jgi:hypothetical protein
MQAHYHWATKRRWVNEKKNARKRKAERKIVAEEATEAAKPKLDGEVLGIAQPRSKSQLELEAELLTVLALPVDRRTN